MTRDQKMYRSAYLIASFVVAATMLAGYQKMLHPADFAVSVYRFHLLPGFMVNLVALYIPWLEIVCAFCLLFVPRWRPAALAIVLVLLLVFTAAIGFNLWRGSAFGCGCFGRGVLDEPLGWLNVARNVGLMLLTALALTSKKRMDSGSNPAA